MKEVKISDYGDATEIRYIETAIVHGKKKYSYGHLIQPGHIEDQTIRDMLAQASTNKCSVSFLRNGFILKSKTLKMPEKAENL